MPLEYFCEKCKKTLQEKEFYSSNNLEKYPDGKLKQCKKCITMHVDNWNPDTYLWIIQECDVPYVPKQWMSLLERYANNPEKVTSLTIFGRYLSTMKMKQYKDYRWKDTEFLQKLEDAKTEQAMKRQGYEQAEIAEVIEKNKIVIPDGEIAQPQYNDNGYEQDDYFARMSGADDDSFDDDLTEEDKTYLRLKWGKTYRPEEWVKLEQLYEEMLSSYDIQSAGDLNTLKLACKCSLKANQLLDIGDIDGAQKATKMYDGLMKSGKWTAAQNKTEESEAIDSVGELVAMCESQGFIPKFYTDGPKDKVDRVIEDLQHYTQDLVNGESGLGTMIETALKQMQEESDRIAAAATIPSETEEEDDLMDYDKSIVQLEDKDFEDFKDFENELEDLDDEFLKEIIEAGDLNGIE